MLNKPSWCPHKDCICKSLRENKICGGHLPKPEPHGNDENIYRWCLKDALPNNEIFDLQINDTDIYAFKIMFDILQDKP